MNEEFNILINKLRNFKRKYYLSQALKGLLISVLLLSLLFIAIDVFEYLFWTNSIVRSLFFYIYLLFGLGIFAFLVFIPLVRMFSIGKTISDAKAAEIIGLHFPEISDKLMNTLQLEESIKDNSNNIELLIASVEQRSLHLRPFEFLNAIELKKNLKYLKWLISPLALIIITLIISPAFVTEPALRIVNHSSDFQKPLPYSFELLNKNLSIIRGEDFKLEVKINGDELPKNIYVNDGKFDYRLSSNGGKILNYSFKKPKESFSFRIFTDEVSSEVYRLRVLEKPIISKFRIDVTYPSYTLLAPEIIENTGDLIVPEGTKLNWRFYTRYTNKFYINFTDDSLTLEDDNNVFTFDREVKSTSAYSIIGLSSDSVFSDSLNYRISVIKDAFPSIEIIDIQQDYLINYLMVSGVISDDYGFSKLYFYLKKLNGDWTKTLINIDKSSLKQQFNHSLNTTYLNLTPGESFEYYYEVWDNDAINGLKSSKTRTLTFELPGKNSLQSKIDSSNNEFKNNLESSIDKFDDLQKQMESFKNNLFEKKNADWKDKQKLKDLINEEKELRSRMSEMSELMQKRDEIREFLKENTNPELEEKLKRLEEQIDKLNDEDMLKKLEDLTKNLEDLDKEQLQKVLDNLQENQNSFKDDLEKQLEFFKQLELEQKVNETSKDLEKLADKQEQLKEKTGERKNKKSDLLKEQNELNQEFNNIDKQLEKLDSLNKSLSKPLDMEMPTEESTNVQNEMNKAAENLNSGSRSKAGKSQTSAVKNMRKMSKQLMQMMQASQQQQMGEDAEQTSKLLDNLVDISFDIESLTANVIATDQNDPKYTENIRQIQYLKEDYSVLHDSLAALSKRQFFIQKFIVNESGKIKMYLNKSTENLAERVSGSGAANLQYAMTSANKLALMLNESLNQMNQSMNMPGSKGGDAKCTTPGSGNSPGLQQMLNMQQTMGNGLKKMGKGKGQTKGGSEGKDGESEKLARMAAQQSEIRRQLQQMMEELDGQGGSGNGLQKILDQMEKQEDDIVNRRITSETLERQKEIETRLLQAENARLEREKEKKREAKEGKNVNRGNPNPDFQYNRENTSFTSGILQRKPLRLNQNLQNVSDKYLFQLKTRIK